MKARNPYPNSPTLTAIWDAFAAAHDRLAALGPDRFLEAARDLWQSSLSDDAGEQLGDALLRIAGEGSIEAAAILNLMAANSPELEKRANAAIAAVFQRNVAARDELQLEALVEIMEASAARLGLPYTLDPATGRKLWTLSPSQVRALDREIAKCLARLGEAKPA